MEQGLLHLYWGDGKGKTTAAMGLALRALGSGKRVVIVQFLKGGNSGEIPLLAQLGAELYRGKAGQKFVFQMTPEEKAATRELQNQNLAAAKEAGTTRAVAAMKKAAQEHPGAILAVGNAPTALLTIAEQIESGLRPALVIGVPVGFVNVVESKERLFAVCEKHDVPAIVAMGRKGGSNVAAAICNALIYSAAEMLDPSARGWK